MSKRGISLCLIFATLVLNMFLPQENARAEVCPTYNFQSLFFEEFYGTKWDNRSGSVEITWSLNGTLIRDENIVRAFTEIEQTWVREAFTSWDDALGTVSFREISVPSLAQISIGLVPLNQPGAAGYWNATWRGNWRDFATIKIKESLIAQNEESLKSKAPFVDSKTYQRNWLVGIVQHELGNVLGLGDIKPDSGVVSIQNDPFSANATVLPLRESDVGMMRQLYGESTCASTFTPAYKAAAELKAKQEAEAKLAAELKAKQEAEAKLAAELKAKQEAEAKLAAELKAKQEAEAQLIREREEAVRSNTFYKDIQACHSIGINAELQILNDGVWKPLVQAKGWDPSSNCTGNQPVQPWTTVSFDNSEQFRWLRWHFWIVGQWDVVGNQFQSLMSTEAKIAYELKAKQEAEAKAASAKAQAMKKTTIICAKGKLIKKVTAVKPVCPAGYKKK